jgi:2-polyprenyl-3-methyl-5-hydroxy-6-metoxy-1,4-benzoquinol methylase
MDEERRLSEKATWYLEEQLDFDRRLIRYRYRSIRPWFLGRSCLELGPAEGVMTAFLLEDFPSVTAVDSARELLDSIADHPALEKVQSLFEEYEAGRQFDTVVLEHILEHVEDPAALLGRARRWVAPGGRLIAGVPNGLSFHRLVAVKMGLLPSPTSLNDRDRALGHRRVYTPESFRREVEEAGLRVLQEGGVFFKPLSNHQIQDQWNETMLEGFFLLGQDFPRNAAELFVVCEPET